MTKPVPELPNIVALIEAGRKEEALAVLTEAFRLAAAAGARSSKAALEAATRLYGGDLVTTACFMNRPHPWLNDRTPLERADTSDEGLQEVIELIGAIEAGVYT